MPAPDAPQPRALQCGGRGRERGGRHQRAGRIRCIDQAAAEFFHHHHRLDGAEAHAAVRFVHRQPGEPELGQFAVHVTRVAASFGDGVPALEAEALVDPACDGIAQRELVVGEFEVHDRPSSAQHGLRNDVALHFV